MPWFSGQDNKKISFYDEIGINKEYYPVPSKHFIPQWYKDIDPYINSKKIKFINGSTNQTIKRCIPVFDSITSGYIIKTWATILVERNNGSTIFNSAVTTMGVHSIDQAPSHPLGNGDMYPKFINAFSIKTPPGYSCIFLPPMHRENDIFTIFPAIVDTDKYSAQINFPFVLKDKEWEGVIEAGTPICQVIPFKRNSWKMEIFEESNLEKHENFIIQQLFGFYRKFSWSKKNFN